MLCLDLGSSFPASAGQSVGKAASAKAPLCAASASAAGVPCARRLVSSWRQYNHPMVLKRAGSLQHCNVPSVLTTAALRTCRKWHASENDTEFSSTHKAADGLETSWPRLMTLEVLLARAMHCQTSRRNSACIMSYIMAWANRYRK